jgi:hypothetical protein
MGWWRSLQLQTTDQLRRWLGGYSSSALPKLPPSVSSPPAPITPQPQQRERVSLMTKIAQVVGLSLEQRLDHARSEIAKLEHDRETLQETRGRRLIDGDPQELLQIEAAISDKDRALVLMRERYAALLAAQDRAAADQRQQRKTEALAAFEKRLAGRVEAARRVEAALAEFGASLKNYDAACSAGFAEWSALFPPLREYGQYSRGNLLDRMASELGMKPVAARVRLFEIAQRVGPIADHDAAFIARLVADIRDADLPKQADKDIAA